MTAVPQGAAFSFGAMMNTQNKEQALDLSAFGTKVELTVSTPVSESAGMDFSSFGTKVEATPASSVDVDAAGANASDKGYAGRRVDDVKRGWNRAMQGVDIRQLDYRTEAGRFLDQIDAGHYKEPVERWEIMDEYPLAKEYRLADPEGRAKIRESLGDRMQGDVTDLVTAEQAISQLPQSEAVQKFGAADGFGPAWDALTDSPVEVISSLATESLGQQAPYLPLMALNPALGAGVGSYMTENSADILGSLRESGVDFSDEDSIREGLSDPEKMAAFRQHAARRGLAIGLVDALSAGLAGRFASGAKTVVGKFIRGAAEDLVMQPVLGATGEAAGALAAGDEISAKDMLAEAAGEIGPGAVETAIGTYRNARAAGVDDAPVTPIAAETEQAPTETLMLTGPEQSSPQLPAPETTYGDGFAMTDAEPVAAETGQAALPAPDQFGRSYGDGFVAGNDLVAPAPGPNYVAMVDKSGAQIGWYNPDTAHAVGKELGAFEAPRRQGPSIDDLMSDGRNADEIRAELVEQAKAARADADVGSVVRVKVPGKRIAEDVRVVGFTPDGAVIETKTGDQIALTDNQIPAPAPVPELAQTSPDVEQGPSVIKDIQNNRLVAEIEQAALRTETPTSEAQADAGNYRKGHVKVQGLDIAIETPRGGVRSGTDQNGKSWSVDMPAHYGYIKRTEGADGDHVDVYLGPQPDSDQVYVIDQIDHNTGKFDEHKVMIGYPSSGQAQADYRRAFNDGRGLLRIGAVSPMSMADFKAWVRNGNTNKPISYVQAKKSRRNDKGQVAVPEDVISFLARLGGVRDNEGHALLKSRDMKRFVPRTGPLIRKTGLSIDEAGEALHEAGYFGPPETTPRPDTSEVLDLLERAISSPTYTPEDQVEVYKAAEENSAREDAALEAEMKADIDQVSRELGEKFSEDEVAAIMKIMIDEKTDAETAVSEYAERQAIQYSEAIYQERLDKDADAIPFFAEEIRPDQDGGTSGNRSDGQQRQAGNPDRGEANRTPSAQGRSPAAETKQPVTDATDQGQQTVIPGAERIKDRELAERRMEGRKASGKPQKDADFGLFDTGARNQQDMFDAPPKTQSQPTASWVIREKSTGEVVMETFDRAKVDALNTDKYEAVPIQEYLASLNQPKPADDKRLTGSAKTGASKNRALIKQMPGTRTSKEYRGQGWNAARAGWAIEDDPYIESSTASEQWRRGWREVQSPPPKKAKSEPTTKTPATEAGVSDSDAAYDHDAHKKVISRLRSGDIAPAELVASYKSFMDNFGAIKAEMSALTKAELARYSLYGKNEKKDILLSSAMDALRGQYNTQNSISYNPFDKGSKDAAYLKAVENTTAEDIADYAKRVADAKKERSAYVAEINKAISNPETYEEFQQFVRYRGAGALTDDQRVRYDELIAEKNYAKREAKREEGRKVSAVDIGDTDMEIVETKHTRDGYDLFVVRLGDRVEKDVYKDLLSKSKQLGGWYSRFRGNGAVPGFQFKSRENAEAFVALRDGDTLKPDATEDKTAKVTDKLRDAAGKIAEKADEKLSADRKVNTARRASMAANTEAAANKDKMTAETMGNIANAIENGNAKHLSQIRFRTDIEMLNSLLRQAQYERIRVEKIKTNPDDRPALSSEDVKYAKYPFPSAHAEHVRDVANAMMQMSGYKLVGKRLQDKASKVLRSDGYRVEFKTDRDISDFDKMAQAASQTKSIGSYVAESLKETKANYGRALRLGFPDTPTLRAALREFLEYRGSAAKVDPVKAAERALIGTNIPGYFPTPRKLVERMIDEAGIEKGMSVLEPEAGKGSIADLVREVSDNVDVIEPVGKLRDILEAKGYNIVASDFLDFSGQYDRIIMNPPFEKRQDVDHVRHAYEQLAPGGRLVAIMSEGPFFGSDKKAVEFRSWLDDLGGVSEKNPEGSFKDSDRSTGVATRLVTIDKAEAAEKYRMSGGISKKRTQLEEAVIAEIKRLAPSVNVETRANGKTLIGGEKAEGGYIPVDDLIWTAMDAADPTHTGRHEVVHHLRATGRLTDAEWLILQRKAKSQWRKQYRVDDYRDQYAGISDIETALDEEAVAEAFADWMETGTGAKGGIARIFRKIKQFFDRIASVVRGQGYQSAEDVFTSIDDGEAGKRATHDLKKMKQQRTEYFAMAGLRKKSGSAAAKPNQKQSPLSDAQDAAIKRSMANIEDEQPMGVRIRETLAGAVDYIKHGTVQHVFDQFDSIKRYEKATYGQLKRASMSAYKMARMTTNLSSTMAAVLRHGPLEYSNGGFKVRDGFDGGFEAIFADLADRRLLKAWKGWAVANRAKRLAAEGRENNMTPADIALLKDLDKQYPEFREVLKKWTAFNKAMLDMAEQTGLLDPDARALFESDDYVPFYRAMDDTPTGPFNKRGLANQRSGINRLKGGETEVNDLIDNMVRNMTHLVDASMKNVAAKRILRTIKTAGLDDGSVIMKVPHDAVPVSVTPEEAAQALENIGVQVQGMSKQQHDQWLKLFTMRPPKDPDVVSVMVGGKAQYFKVNDPLLLASMTSLGAERVHWLVSMLGYPKRWLTTGITSTPGFMLRNFIRDSMHGWVVSGENFTPGIDGFKGAIRSYREDTALVSIMAAGGGSGGFFRTQSRDVAKMMSSAVNGKKSVIDSPKKAWEWWRKVGQATENANRIAIYDSVLKDTGDVSEAAFQALDIMDFSMRGDSKVVQFLIGTIPFLNARMQGLYRLGRGMKEKPKAFILRGGLITAATMLLYSMNSDDDRYDDLPEWEKDAYYHIFLDKIFPAEALEAAGIKADEVHVRMPKPFEVGALFSTIPERATRLAQGKDDISKYGDRMWSMVRDTFAVDLPQFVKPLAEQWANEVTFTGSPIVPERMKDLAPEAQYDARTSELAKQIGDALPDFMGKAKSPKRIEAAVRAFFGSYGVYVMGIADEMLDPIVDNPVEPDMRADQMPEIGSFIRQQPYRSTRFISEFYDLKREIEAVAKTYKQYRSQGQIDDAKDLMADGGNKKVAMAGWMRRKAKQMSGINKNIRAVEESRSLSSSQKREQIDKLSENRNELAKQVVNALNKAGIK